jgi:O-antigen ligase
MMRLRELTATRADASATLTVYIVLLWAIPSPMVVQALGSAGAPSNILAMTTLFLWAWFHVRRTEPTGSGPQPVRTAMISWVLIMLVVYAHAMAGPIPPDEVSVGDSGLLRLFGMAGILLLATDGISSLETHRTLVRRLVVATGVVALFGLVQGVTHRLYVDMFSIPGLSSAGWEWAFSERGGFARPSGTSTSPIEYGVVLGMMLPLAISYGMKSPTRRWLYKTIALLVVVAIFLSVSRSAYLCAAVGLIVMAMHWTAGERVQAFALVGAVSVGVYLMVPSMLGTILGLFSIGSEDPSVASRTGSYDQAWHYFLNSPVLGRGFGTFLPKYWILDNGYLGLLIEGGILGLAGLIAVVWAGIAAARKARSQLVDELDRDVAHALGASIAAGAAGLAFFDTFAFPQTAGCFFLLIGLAGALRRLTQPGPGAEPAVPRPKARAVS